jgi:hypothetical protein
MALKDRHPRYTALYSDWQLCRDCVAGERQVKSRRTEYLPATSGMIFDGMDNPNQPGSKAYESYLTRAVFPAYQREAVEHMLGIMHAKPPKIELPKALEPMLERASIDNESMAHLLKRINGEQLTIGRVGLLLDMPDRPTVEGPNLYIALYRGETIINWDSTMAGSDRPVLNLVVLDESRYERDSTFRWELTERYRVLTLGDPDDNEPTGVYAQGLFSAKDSLDFNPVAMRSPNIRGNTLDEIPFEFINSKDTLTDPDEPPLLGLANLCMTVYRGEADYRQNLFMQGQDTLVVIGAPDSDDHRVGAGARLDLPANADAKYIGVQSQGLTEQRLSLENDRGRAAQMSGQLATAKSKQIESGEALQTRIAAATANLNSIAISGAAGLQNLLRKAAKWIGADPDQVKVIPNLEFEGLSFAPRDLVELMSAKTMGAPLSVKSIHQVLAEKGYTRLDLETELAEIEGEEPLGTSIMDATGGTQGSQNVPGSDPSKDPPVDPKGDVKNNGK